jgi:uncharacterized protein YhbP (UPF0306 family)
MALSLPPEVAAYLAQHHVMTLATQGSDGPWAAAVFYVDDDGDLVFLSSPSSRHGRNLTLEPRCAATIHAEVDDWRSIRGIQLEGRVHELQGDDRARARQRYEARFPLVRGAGAPVAIVQALARVRWYRLCVARLYFIDNRRGFGQRQLFEASPTAPTSIERGSWDS